MSLLKKFVDALKPKNTLDYEIELSDSRKPGTFTGYHSHRGWVCKFCHVRVPKAVEHMCATPPLKP